MQEKETCFWCDNWQGKIDCNYFSNCSLKILNLHRKLKYQQTKNIARFLNH